jgi:hypothetical protein
MNYLGFLCWSFWFRLFACSLLTCRFPRSSACWQFEVCVDSHSPDSALDDVRTLALLEGRIDDAKNDDFIFVIFFRFFHFIFIGFAFCLYCTTLYFFFRFFVLCLRGGVTERGGEQDDGPQPGHRVGPQNPPAQGRKPPHLTSLFSMPWPFVSVSFRLFFLSFFVCSFVSFFRFGLYLGFSSCRFVLIASGLGPC